MDWLEQELKTALGRKDPPADFAGRVMAQAQRGAAPIPMPARFRPRWLAAAAAVALTVGAGFGYRQYRGEMAKQQLMQAVRIASTKVNRIQAQVREAGR